MKKIILLLLLPLSVPSGICKQPQWELDTVVIRVTESYEEEILRILLEEGLSLGMAEIVVAQARHESGNFTSPIFEENWNPFGMKRPRLRKTTAIGSNRGHAVYPSLSDAVLDYVFYLRARQIPFDIESVSEFVIVIKNKGYFEDSYRNYVRGVRGFFEESRNV